jgi:hypothetical protein
VPADERRRVCVGKLTKADLPKTRKSTGRRRKAFSEPHEYWRSFPIGEDVFKPVEPISPWIISPEHERLLMERICLQQPPAEPKRPTVEEFGEVVQRVQKFVKRMASDSYGWRKVKKWDHGSRQSYLVMQKNWMDEEDLMQDGWAGILQGCQEFMEFSYVGDEENGRDWFYEEGDLPKVLWANAKDAVNEAADGVRPYESKMTDLDLSPDFDASATVEPMPDGRCAEGILDTIKNPEAKAAVEKLMFDETDKMNMKQAAGCDAARKRVERFLRNDVTPYLVKHHPSQIPYEDDVKKKKKKIPKKIRRLLRKKRPRTAIEGEKEEG